MVDLSEADPGRFWRRMARVGAVVLTAAAFLAFDPRGHNWREFKVIWDNLFEYHMLKYRMRGMEYLLGSVIYSLSIVIYVAGPIFIIVSDRNIVRRSIWRIVFSTLLSVGLLAAVGIVYISLFVLVKSSFNPPGIGVFCIPSLLLFIAALALSSGWHRMNSLLSAFWPGTVLAVLPATIWSAQLAFWMIMLSHTDRAWHTYLEYIYPFCLGFIGSILLLTGWLLWWRAVRRALKAQEAAADGNA